MPYNKRMQKKIITTHEYQNKREEFKGQRKFGQLKGTSYKHLIYH